MLHTFPPGPADPTGRLPLWITATEESNLAHHRHVSSLDIRRPFTRADAVAAGIDPRELRGSRFRRIFRGVYVSAAVDDTAEVRALAGIALQAGDAAASHTTAALLYGVPVPATPETHLTVECKSFVRQRPLLTVHVSKSPPDTRAVQGVRTTSPVDTFVALARVLDLVDLVIAGDAMVRLGLTTCADLRAATSVRHDAGSVRARDAARWVRAAVDSPTETRLRMLLVLSGLPEPVVNHQLRDESGDPVFRFDLSYPWLRLAIEYDGRQHAQSTHVWQRDIRRREDLDRAGWLLLVFTAADLFRHPASVLERVADAMRRQGYPPHRLRFTRDWQRHFMAAA